MRHLHSDDTCRCPTAGRAIGLAVLILCGLVTGTTLAPAETASCPMDLERSANDAVATINNWMDLYAAFTHYRSCDDGAIAEGFSDRITTLLATRWATLPQLGKLAGEHQEFGVFVLSHIDETTDPKNLRLIVANVNNQGCPGIAKAMCSDIRKDAMDALAILAQ